MQILVAHAKLSRWLLSGWAAIAGAGLFAEIARPLLQIRHFPHWPGLFSVIWTSESAFPALNQGWNRLLALFSLSYEYNLPNWYSACLLFLAAVLLALLARQQRQQKSRWVAQWGTLSVLFGYISLDESVCIHEHMNAWFNFKGVLHFGWVIPASLILALLTIFFWRFVFSLPLAGRRRIIWAGAIYVCGALGMEFPLGAWVTYSGTDDNPGYALLDWVGESLEILGTSLFILALVRLLDEPASETSESKVQ